MAWIDEFRTKLDPRARDTRIAFYEAADRWTADRDPRLQDLVAASGKAQNAFYDHFGGAGSTGPLKVTINPERKGVEAVFEQAKAWLFQPWLDGWAEQARRLRLGPRKRLETLVQITARWAEEHRCLASRDDCALPAQLHEAVQWCGLRSHSRPLTATQLERTAEAIVRDAVRFVVNENAPGSVVGALGSVRAAIAALDLDEHGLEAQTWKVIRAIVDLMQMLSAADEQPSPRLQGVLSRASRAITRLRDDGPAATPRLRASLEIPATTMESDDSERSEEPA
ncbi:hypothetical protein EV651_12311 [Kribbella sp. VKM Ac-2571]|uniref:hypothetical protein n=1 Tax=Kribbella sp. VKM Ac-2571 TaxID=2512222 RepID=UPI00105D87F6|nr:hypothetical protein [Kribbella sp. VKM Ac-2571]TDO48245.1 hypothetical protein EV651_12311 [Kribbella sp. VKM Ac-2571]